VLRLLRSQLESGWVVSVASPAGEFSTEVVGAGGRWLEWDAGRSPGPMVPAETRALAAVAGRAGADVIHLHSSKAGLAGRLNRRMAPRIFQPHGWSWDAVGPTAGRVVRAWERFAAGRCDLLICVSEEERTRGEAAGLNAPWCVIENAVDLERFPRCDDSDRAAAREELGLPSGPLAVCVGPLRHQKGQDLLLTAWPLVRREIPDATLVLVGAGSERGRLESLAGPGVVFAGHREDVVTWLAAAAVVTIPSRWDGLSLSLLEAMSCARSVVATDTPGAGRVLNGGGEVVPIGDTGALAGALTTRLRDPSLAAAEGDRGRARVEQDFDWRRVIEQMNAAYGRVISGQP